MDIWRWIREYGQIWFVRGVFIATATYWTLSSIGVPWAPLDLRVVIALNIAILWLVFERMNAHFALKPYASVMPWTVFGPYGNELIRRASEVDIVCSSGGTFHSQFAEALIRRSDLRIRVLMRKRASDSPLQEAKLSESYSYWMALHSPSAKRTVAVRMSNQDLLRGMRIDETVALGYYSLDPQTRRLVGHTVELLVVEHTSPHSLHFRRVFTSLFDRLWAEASEMETKELESSNS